MKLLSSFLLLVLLSTALSCTKKQTQANKEQVGLMIIDAQKWFIPGHKESVYTRWNITGQDRSSESIISSLDSVLSWANDRQLPVIVTYEATDTGSYDLPTELKEDLDSHRTTHFIKEYYGAPKHQAFLDILQRSNIKHWILIGAETDVCVYQTAKELLRLNMKVTLVDEALYSGRNNTGITKQSLKSFGANFISLQELYRDQSLFTNEKPNPESHFSFENTVLTIYPGDATINNGDAKRLEYLKTYASITGLHMESPEQVSSTKKRTRLVAGAVSPAQFETLRKSTQEELILIADCVPQLNKANLPATWRKHTLKTVFYELMETAAFYTASVDELEGWQKELKKALLEERLGYVETLQNEE